MIRVTIVCMVFLSFMVSIAASSDPKKFKVAMETASSFPIYRKAGDDHKKDPGVFFEFIKILEQKMNIEINVIRLPWKRCLKTLENGKVHGILTASYKSEREKIGVYPKRSGKIDPSRRFSASSYYLYVKKNSPIKWNGKTFDNLNGLLGAQLGFSIVDELKNMGIPISEVKHAEMAFLMLNNNRVEGVAIHEDEGDIYMKKYGNIIKVEPPLSTKPYYLLISHQLYNSNPDFVSKLWDTASEIRESEELKMIKEKYYAIGKWLEK